MEGMDISKEDSKKRGRSETSVSEADTILIEDSKDANQINTNESKETSKFDNELISPAEMMRDLFSLKLSQLDSSSL